MRPAWMPSLVALTAAFALALAAPSAPAATLAQVGSFTSPVYVTGAPGDTSRLFVVEQGGTIRVIKDGVTLTNPFLDLTNQVLSGGERGLLSVAFPPDYQASRRFYVYYTSKPNGDIHVDEFQRSAGNADVAAGGSQRPLFTIAHSEFANHNGGQLQFDANGLLYAGTGDGGSGGDPHGNAQNDGSMLGKLLRLNPVQTTTPSIFSKGLRNPWRFSFDRQTGDLVIADVGQGQVEEIDYAAAPGLGQGANYGWDQFEGNDRFEGTAGPAGMTFPVVTHTHNPEGWCSITGGYVVRDPGLPELLGRYVYGDFCKGDIYSVTLPAACNDGPTGMHVANLTSFGQDTSGRIYAASQDGPVYRLTSTGGTSTGCSSGGGTPGSGAPPGTTAGGPAATPDRTAPVVQVKARRRQHTARKLRFTLSCNETCRVRIRAATLGNKTAALLTNRTLAARAHVVLALNVRRAVRRSIERRLRRGRTVAVNIRITVKDAAGNTSGRALTMRIRR